MTQHRYSLDEIDARALPRAREICGLLFGQIRTSGGNIWMLSPTRSDPNWTSFSFNERSGIWKDFGGSLGGGKGVLSLVAASFTNSEARDYTRAIPWLKDALGLTGREPSAIERQQLARDVTRRDVETQQQQQQSRRKALGLWLHGEPLTGNDAASVYLHVRGIDVTTIGIPRALRFHPQVYASDADEKMRGPWPCMLGAIARYGDGIVAVHRTYLRATDTCWRKRTWPDCKTGKQVKGAYAGGYIALTRGSSGKPLREATEDEWPAVSEGIEDALTAALARPDLRHIAAVSIANIGGLALPPQVRGVYIVKQNDSDPATVKQFEQQMDRLCARGIEPAIVEFPAAFKDANDVLRGVTRQEFAA
jgi:hypothetical protein